MYLIKSSWGCTNFRRFTKSCYFRWASSTSASRAANRVVLISTSDSIYENLALEEWMYEKTDFSDTDYLLMWRNKPAVVFGRHQNPWLEVNIPLASTDGVDIARRCSGGGTVYHDEGNLNLSFLKSRLRYNRKENLHLVVDAVKTRWDLDLIVNDRDDILLDHFYKVSGTAAKLGRTQSFHHFTLLFDVDTSRLSRLLDSPMHGVDSKATKSVPSSVLNLKEKALDMTFELLVDVIGQRFLQQIDQQMTPQNAHFINPINEAEFPGIKDILSRLKSWNWIYGKTPKFSLHRTFSGHEFRGHVCTLNTEINIEKGHVVSISLHLNYTDLDWLVTTLNTFYSENVHNLALENQSLSQLKEKCLTHIETLLSLENTEALFCC
ncbi:unnamed protein product [Candidula unifasciata]|uniref:BPL/LPL catalytic domain-containing protein n=1 Tax=Candidula unifasciata TaxID=100452 RepID=A0A8S3Z7B3_9EUPU|nr:unnamed protein product [Candidula unifasciata]